MLTEAECDQFRRDGHIFPIRAMSADDAAGFRAALERYEADSGGPISGNLRHKTHLLFTWASEIAHTPAILDAVESLLGPDIMLWGSSFFIKEPGSSSFVSWHQDATYWGLDGPDIVTAWVALADAPVESGAMRFWPGSHHKAQIPHTDTFSEENLLSRGQEIAVDVPEDEGIDVPLKAGEMSLHHVLLVHGSKPNRSNDRRIGFALRYIPTHLAQTKTRDYATLVRGEDTHHNFVHEPRPAADLDIAAVAAHKASMEAQVAALYEGTTKTAFRA
ncbi:phytanoyl-CoA dioxygenase family protein [Acuticoccus sp. MNP-M23]|uniref:phytanoyl-CoA dioxygenase family protein n=1 Tax=Acuticoccus sp. MNP-M23 TaxID=3072793 RepID=UPI002816722B|nr:phytanoyl-CoA dioxygenase family protein [Acuticoccus sp. MNP-M23]WMS42335.1 phytanoyl-CoA dioxygenase family protein [Acuticoccus sp. MNP-M23]